MKKEISIIIVTYNSLKLISDCINSIIQNNDIGDRLEIIVVDNNSEEKEEMFSFLENKYRDKISLIDSGKNGGYGYGNNIGIRSSQANKVIVMNPDVRFVFPILKQISEALNHDNVGMLGVDFVDGSSPYYFKRGHSSLFRELFAKYYIWKKKYDANEMYLSGSFLAFDKDAFVKAGMFDENIFMYSEEADITNRMIQNGYNVIWCPNIKVLHLAHGRTFNPILDKIRLESGAYYEKKYGIDSEKSYKLSVQALTIRYWIAKLLMKKTRAKNYSLMLDSLVKFHKKPR